MTKRHLTIATRESPLAMRQAESVRDLLLEKHPHLSIDLLGITTQADKRLDINLLEIGGKGHSQIAVYLMQAQRQSSENG